MRKGRWRRAAIRVIVFALLACLLCPLALAEDQMIDPAYPVPQYVHWLLDVARGELGYQEGSRGYTKYGEWSGDPYAEWCAEFLCWCVDRLISSTDSACCAMPIPCIPVRIPAATGSSARGATSPARALWTAGARSG